MTCQVRRHTGRKPRSWGPVYVYPPHVIGKVKWCLKAIDEMMIGVIANPPAQLEVVVCLQVCATLKHCILCLRNNNNGEENTYKKYGHHEQKPSFCQ